MSAIKIKFYPNTKPPDKTAVPLVLPCIQISHQRFFCVLQPAVVHLQGQETTIQVREGGSSVCSWLSLHPGV